MRFISFNINGIRARLHQLKKIICKFKPDIIGLQETKVHDDLFPYNEINNYGYNVIFYGKKQHCGVALISREKPIFVDKIVNKNIKIFQYRIIIANFNTNKGILTVVNIYCPQGDNKNNKIKFLIKKIFYFHLHKYINENYDINNSLLLIMGDMNICPTYLDVGIGEKNKKEWLRIGKCSFLPEEITWIDKLIDLGLIDIYRQFYPFKNNIYSWFDYRLDHFNKNIGLRIDLMLASKLLTSFSKFTDICYSIRSMSKPSDHVPILTDFDI